MILPHSLESEQAVLGSILCDPKLAAHVFTEVKPADFYAPAFATIAGVLRGLDSASRPIDKISVFEALRAKNPHETGEEITSRISSLMNTVQTTSTAMYHAKVIAEKAMLRRLITAGEKIAQTAKEGESDVAAALAECDATLRDAIGAKSEDGVKLSDGLQSIYREVAQAMDGEAKPALKTPWRTLDHLTGGMHSGELVVAAGAPGMGKSAFASQIAIHAARTRGQAIVFALEMGATDTIRRILSSHARLDLRALRRGDLHGAQLETLGESLSALTPLPMWFYAGRRSVADVRRIARARAQEGPLGVVVVDHPGYLREAHVGSKTASKHERLEYVYLELRMIAQEIEAPIVIVQHLNRAGMQGAPSLGNLRDGGNLEGHAHMVIFPYREEPEANPTVGELIVAKNRDGSTGRVQMRFDGAMFAWSESGAFGNEAA